MSLKLLLLKLLLANTFPIDAAYYCNCYDSPLLLLLLFFPLKLVIYACVFSLALEQFVCKGGKGPSTAIAL